MLRDDGLAAEDAAWWDADDAPPRLCVPSDRGHGDVVLVLWNPPGAATVSQEREQLAEILRGGTDIFDDAADAGGAVRRQAAAQRRNHVGGGIRVGAREHICRASARCVHRVHGINGETEFEEQVDIAGDARGRAVYHRVAEHRFARRYEGLMFDNGASTRPTLGSEQKQATERERNQLHIRTMAGWFIGINASTYTRLTCTAPHPLSHLAKRASHIRQVCFVRLTP